MLEFTRLQRNTNQHLHAIGYRLENMYDIVDDEAVRIQLREIAELVESKFKDMDRRIREEYENY